MEFKRKKQSSVFKTSLLLILSGSLLLTGCGGKNNATGEGDEAPTKITMQTLNYAQDMVDNSSPLWQELEKKTNTELEITWLTPTTIQDKVNVMLASGDLPDVTFVESLNNSQLQKMIQQGVFWDLSPYIKDYPNLSRPDLAQMWEDSKVNGKNYAIPRYYPSYGGGMFPMLRKDWLDNLGLEVPTTMDEFFDVLVAFRDKDPNGNGQKDEIPYATAPTSLLFVYGIYNETLGNWKLKDGKLVPIITEDASRDALLWIKKAFDEGLLPKDFAIMKFSQVVDLFRGGKVGASDFSMNAVWGHGKVIKEVDPEAELIPTTYLENPNGVKYTPSGPPYYGVYLIPKKVPEEKMKKILELFDYGNSPEGNVMMYHGFKDVHYKEVNGKKELTEQGKKDMVGDGNMSNLFHLISDDMSIGFVGMPDELYERNVQIVNERKKVQVPDPSRGLYSDTYNRLYPEIEKKVEDMRTKVIIGLETIEAYDQFIEQLKQDKNLQLITEEMNKEYEKKMASE
ncbi:extracellular solute-binding protein [Paenibacillus faecalis]|uniref:extracellular solute-binding protein n=1 Tax=Paenibacillus faecalis TaxID=2079532 RepID=UPI000D0EF24C|nr:extracellular solute-binding protein [Paenibacillus faecalis]